MVRICGNRFVTERILPAWYERSQLPDRFAWQASRATFLRHRLRQRRECDSCCSLRQRLWSLCQLRRPRSVGLQCRSNHAPTPNLDRQEVDWKKGVGWMRSREQSRALFRQPRRLAFAAFSFVTFAYSVWLSSRLTLTFVAAWSKPTTSSGHWCRRSPLAIDVVASVDRRSVFEQGADPVTSTSLTWSPPSAALSPKQHSA